MQADAKAAQRQHSLLFLLGCSRKLLIGLLTRSTTIAPAAAAAAAAAGDNRGDALAGSMGSRVLTAATCAVFMPAQLDVGPRVDSRCATLGKDAVLQPLRVP
jgi:hypothetical protein